MSRARLRLSGAISFIAALYGQLVGFIFSVLIARRLSPEVFGLWAYIGTLVSYSLIPVNLVGTWVGRDAARGRKVMVPTLVTASFLVPAGSAIYLAGSIMSGSRIGFGFETLALGLIVLIPNSIVNLLLAITSGYAPQYAGVGSVAFETTKLAAAVILVLGLGDSSIGSVLLAVALGHVAYLLTLLFSVRGTIGIEDVAECLRRWSKGMAISALSVSVGVIASFDVILMSLLTSGTLIAAYWQAVTTIGLLTYATSNLIGGLLPRLLAGGGESEALKSLHFTMTFAVPVLFGSVVLSDYLLSVLNPVYSSAWLAASLICVANFIGILVNFFGTLFIGTERFDEFGVPTFKEYMRSRIAIGIYISGVISPIYIAALFAVLNVVRSPLELTVGYMALVKLLTSILTLLIYYRLVRRHTTFRFPSSELLSYIGSAVVMSAIVLLLRFSFGSPEAQVFATLREIGIMVATGGLTYFCILYPTSPRFRSLIRDVRLFISRS